MTSHRRKHSPLNSCWIKRQLLNVCYAACWVIARIRAFTYWRVLSIVGVINITKHLTNQQIYTNCSLICFCQHIFLSIMSFSNLTKRLTTSKSIFVVHNMFFVNTTFWEHQTPKRNRWTQICVNGYTLEESYITCSRALIAMGAWMCCAK